MSNRKFVISSISVLALLLAACGGAATPAAEAPADEPAGEAPAGDATEATSGGVEVAAGLCSNTYYPVVVGATHTYAGTALDGSAYSFTDTVTDVRSDGFTLTSQFDGLTRTQEWECSPEGLVALQYESGASAGLAANGLSGEFTTTQASGVTLPADVKAGDTWSQSFSIEGQINMGEAGEATAAGDVSISYTAIGEEEVQTAAGTFTALRVESHLTFNLIASFQSLEVPVQLETDTVSWYAPGVGWVKSEDTTTMSGTEPFSSALDMQSYAIP